MPSTDAVTELLPFFGIPLAIALVGMFVVRNRRRRKLPPLADLEWDEPVARRGCGPDVTD